MTSYGHLADVVRQKGPAAGSRFIVQMLETGLELEGLEKDKERERQGKGINPFFTMVGKCPRQSYFTLTGEEPTNPLDVNSRMNFKVGHAVEDAVGSVLTYVGGPPPDPRQIEALETVSEALEEIGAEVRRELPMEFRVDGVRVSGRLDFALFLLDIGILLETKATNRFAIKYMLERNEPRAEHYSQLNLYLHGSHMGLLDEAFGQKVRFDLAYLVYLVQGATKGEPVAHAWPVEYGRDKALADLAYLALLQKRADAKDDPGIPAGMSKTKFPCSYCSFQERCWSSGAGRWHPGERAGVPASATGGAA